MTALPKTARGHDAIAVFVDRLSKYVNIIPTKMTITAIQFATIFRDNIFRLQGMPISLISDCNPRFTSDFWTVLFESLETAAHASMETAQGGHRPRKHGNRLGGHRPRKHGNRSRTAITVRQPAPPQRILCYWTIGLHLHR
jgi:hypothetical protein